MKTNPRALSIKILCRRQETGHPVDQVMEQLLTAEPCSPQDRQLVMAIVFGVLRRQRYLDFILAGVSRHPLAKMKNLTLQALRVGLYQLAFMDRIPPSAAVNETVAALRAARQPKWLTGFVNGLLRTLARKDGLLAQPGEIAGIPPAVAHSHPDWLFDRWQQRFGREKAVAICAHNNSRPGLCLCVNSRRISRSDYLDMAARAGIAAQAGEYSPDAVLLEDFKGPVSGLPGYEQGFFIIQDEGAQLITGMLFPLRLGKYLDACAGLGGKTIQLAHMAPEGSHVTAIEPNIHRFDLLRENIARLGLDSIVTCCNCSLADFASSTEERFDAVLVDAPCSGLGVIRRQPDIRWNRCPDDLRRYHEEQLHLLDTAVGLIAPDGSFVYATCSTEPEENDGVAGKFLQKHADFSPAKTEELAEYLRIFINEQGFLQFLPEEGHDGFFAARFTKKGDRRQKSGDRITAQNQNILTSDS
ncbi:MAG: 16S rRNA (cytosine(967)-C(5))-methyltransferase [Desulfobulbaceae bacterium DB1]|nr:MAG: 16S rRNA (cytosine(967)-C(5))-methyltransferase [Desulfobulbaceae bacterium DB1]